MFEITKPNGTRIALCESFAHVTRTIRSMGLTEYSLRGKNEGDAMDEFSRCLSGYILVKL